MTTAPSWLAEAVRLDKQLGCFPLGKRTLIEVLGRDRIRLLQNLCTADLRERPTGSGTELFLPSLQGKVIGHLLAYFADESVWLETVPDQAATLLPHLDRYIIREDVQLFDRSSEQQTWVVTGARESKTWNSLVAMFDDSLPLPFAVHVLAGEEVRIRRTPWADSCVALDCPVDVFEWVGKHLESLSVGLLSAETWESRRIEAGFPWLGIDLTAEQLVQEVGRDAQAISYKKGCYLGQETIARIDALGHVNQLLRGLAIEGEAVPTVGAEWTRDGKSVVRFTSVTYSPLLGKPLGLGYVRRGSYDIGTQLNCEQGQATVVQLPVTRTE